MMDRNLSNARIIELIKRDFEAGEATYLDAIDEIQRRCGCTPIEAETIVSDWEEDKPGE